MLVTNSKLKLICWTGTFVLSLIVAGSVVGQQTPSQRYLPVRQSAYEAPARSSEIQDARRLPTAIDQRSVTAPAPAPSIPDQSAYYPEQANRGMIQRTSYQEPAVPEILAGQTMPATQPSSLSGFAAPKVSSFQPSNPMSDRTPADYSNKLGVRTTPIESPLQDTTDAETIAREMQRMRELDQARRANQIQQPSMSNIPVNAAPASGGTMPRVDAAMLQPLPQEKTLAPATTLPSVEQSRMMATRMAAERIENENAIAQQSSEMQTGEGRISPRVSATQFTAEVRTPAAQENLTSQAESNALRLIAMQGQEAVSPAMQLATGSKSQLGDIQQDGNVAPVSNVEPIDEAVVELAAPSINVITRGPDTIGINKPVQYQVVVQNNSIISADRILVGVSIPEWVEIESVSLTGGGKEITDGKNQARLVWSIDRVEGNSNQTLTITAVPRKAEVFDVGVEWTLVPRTGKANIRVTEPKLEMNISGPKDVLFGETATYHVAIRNPGTGAAEDVTVMLPEALGGERQSLGSIPAGKEKNFEISLLARTAGDLNLVATATADGNLKTSAEKALKVRRGQLQVSMTGPGIRYAGDSGKYTIKVSNTGDATATQIFTAVALPPGVKYLQGIESVKLIEGGMRWPVGSLDPGQTKTYTMECQLDTSGDVQLEVGAQADRELAASGACLTTVETIADLVLTVSDLKGPLPTGKAVPYTIKIRNRGTKAAKRVSVNMQFSEGVDPKEAKGLQHRITDSGMVEFEPIEQIAPGQEMVLEVTAMASKSGIHIFRAQLKSDESEAHEIAEGTTRFYGDSIAPPKASVASENSFESGR